MSGKRLEGLTERISEAVNIGGGAAAISRATGYQRSTINNWTSGQSEPSASALIRIAQVTGASLTWLATGEGSMRSQPVGESLGMAVQRVAMPQHGLGAALRGEYGPAAGASPYREVPRKAFHVSAGDGAIVEEPLADLPPLAFRADWLRRAVTAPDKAVILTVRGDSMVPTIQDGDLVLIDQAARTIGAGGIFVARIGDDVVVKRLAPSQHPGRVRAISDNADLYPPFDAPADEVAIIGRVRWVGRAL